MVAVAGILSGVCAVAVYEAIAGDDELKPTIWKNCYSQQWAGILIPPAFSHPAKISLALVKRIFSHAIEKGWIKKGDTCGDPFAGVGGVAFGAALNGIKFIGQELEPHFVDLANGVECTGISKADWVRFYGRWEKVNCRDGRYWCPNCLAQAKQIINPIAKTKDFFDLLGTASYERNSGKIPSTLPHHFEGNLEFWRRRFNLDGAIIIQGDSRRLLENLREQVECVVSSPPFGEAQTGGTSFWVGAEKHYKRKFTDKSKTGGYQKHLQCKTSGNLGNLPAGNFDAVISSPPFLDAGRGDKRFSGGMKDLSNLHIGSNSLGGLSNYGDSQNNLGNLPAGNFDAVIDTIDNNAISLAEIIISSPPYVNSLGNGNGIDQSKLTGNPAGPNSQAFSEGYGDSPMQLGSMPEGCFDIAVSSPPFESSIASGNNNSGILGQMRKGENKTVGGIIGKSSFQDYGKTENQLGNSTGETFWSAAREIVQQCFLALKPGGHAIWVTKRFVRNGEIVEFSQQWAKLCESIGFKVVCWHHAMLTENGATQIDLDGNDDIAKRERKSFFRRLAEKKGSPPIDWEDVICMVKPALMFERLFIDGRNGAAKLKTETVEV